MNQTFSLHRFQLLVKLDLAEKGKNYLLMAGLFSGLLLLFMLPITWRKDYSEILFLLHALALFMVVMFGGSLYTTSVFSQYSSPDTGIAALMIPASRLEKYLSALLINLLFIIPFTLLFFKLHIWTIDFANDKMNPGQGKYNYLPKELLQYFISMHIIIQGSVFLGSIYFPKLSYIKTAAVLFTSAIFIGVLSWYLAKYFTSNPTNVVAFPFSAWKVWYEKSHTNFYVDFPESVQPLVNFVPVLFLLSVWFIAYVRLKEKEI